MRAREPHQRHVYMGNFPQKDEAGIQEEREREVGRKARKNKKLIRWGKNESILSNLSSLSRSGHGKETLDPIWETGKNYSL